MAINNIAVTGDFLRVEKSGRFSQPINIRWLYHLIMPLISSLTDRMSVHLTYGEWSGGENIAEKFYTASGQSPSLEAWAKAYNGQCNSRQEALLEAYFADSLVVAFELPGIVARGLSKLGIPYIDFTMHPIRFMRQLAFGARSNLPYINIAFEPWLINETEFGIEAGIAMASLSRLPRIHECMNGDDIAVFACQTSEDKVLLNNGSFLKAVDFADEFRKICQMHEKVLVKPHPYEKNGQFEIFLLHQYDNTQLIEENFYHIVNHENISTIYSISSSTSIESVYLGKKGVHLGRYPYIFDASSLTEDNFLPVWPCFTEPVFWHDLLSSIDIPTRKLFCKDINLDVRASMHNWWGADILYK